MLMDTKCYFCGAEVPEGRSVCHGCELEAVRRNGGLYEGSPGAVNTEHKVPKTVRAVVVSLLIDYRRRAGALEDMELDAKLRASYTRLNAAVDEALECIEVGIRNDMMRDIIIGRGHRSSPIKLLMAKNTYYRRRSKLIYDIAKKLMLF